MIIHLAGKKNSQLYLRNLEQKLVFSQISTHSLGPGVDDTDVTPSKKSSLATRNPNEVSSHSVPGARGIFGLRHAFLPHFYENQSIINILYINLVNSYCFPQSVSLFDYTSVTLLYLYIFILVIHLLFYQYNVM